MASGATVVTEIVGATTRQIDQAGDDYAYLLEEALDRVARKVAARWSPTSTEDDLAAFRILWLEEIDRTLAPTLALLLHTGAAGVRDQLRSALTASAVVEAFHLPGKHVQKSHGGDGKAVPDLTGEFEDAGLSPADAARAQAVIAAFQERYGVGIQGVFETPDGDEGLVARVRGPWLEVNAKLLNDEALGKLEADGFLAPGVGTVEGLMTHELGHVVLQGGGMPREAVIQANRDTRERYGVIQGKVSTYSSRDWKEQEAELFAHYHLGGDRREPWVIGWGEVLHEAWQVDAVPLTFAAERRLAPSPAAGEYSSPGFRVPPELLVSLGLTAAATRTLAEIPQVSPQVVDAYLATARNRLAGAGDLLWEAARDQLREGTANGESHARLAQRIRRATGLALPRARVIARTEARDALLAGSLNQVRATGLTGTKTWVAVRGKRTRPEHRHAQGQTVDLRGFFEVGGWPMDRPHDETAPAELTISCRCGLKYSLDTAGVLLGPAPTRATADDRLLKQVWDGGMVRAGVTVEDLARLLQDLGLTAATEPFHLPGEHDQDKHGRDRRLPDGGGYVRRDNPPMGLDLAELDRMAIELLDYDARSDPVMAAIQQAQGFDGSPQQVSPDELQTMVTDGGMLTWRAFRGDDQAEADRRLNQWTDGDLHAGIGTYGSGTYTGGLNYVEDWARLEGGSRVVPIVVRGDARVISDRDLVGRIEAEWDDLPEFLRDPGRYAAWHGYDAIRVYRTGVDPDDDEDFFVILNRTAAATTTDPMPRPGQMAAAGPGQLAGLHPSVWVARWLLVNRPPPDVRAKAVAAAEAAETLADLPEWLQPPSGTTAAAEVFHPGHPTQKVHGHRARGQEIPAGESDISGPLTGLGVDPATAARVQKVNAAFQDRYGVGVTVVRAQTDDPKLMAQIEGDTLIVNPPLINDTILGKLEADGFLAPGVGTVEGLMFHELGHVVLQGGRYDHRPVLIANRGARRMGAGDAEISGYSRANGGERDAERFASYHRGGDRRPQWLIGWGDILHEEMGVDRTPITAAGGVTRKDYRSPGFRIPDRLLEEVLAGQRWESFHPGHPDQKVHGRRGRGRPGGIPSPSTPASKPAGNRGGGEVSGATYDDLAAARKFLDGHYGTWKKKTLTDAEYAGLAFYQSPGFALMNGQRRGLKRDQIKADMTFGDADLKRARKASADLAKGIAKAPPLPEAIIAHRGFDAAQFGDLQPGMRVSDNGFVSLSLTSEGVAAVGKAAKPGVMRLELPAGTKAGAGSARELILDGADIDIIAVRTEGGTTYVDARLVGTGGTV
jgi:hypothetical protein